MLPLLASSGAKFIYLKASSISPISYSRYCKVGRAIPSFTDCFMSLSAESARYSTYFAGFAEIHVDKRELESSHSIDVALFWLFSQYRFKILAGSLHFASSEAFGKYELSERIGMREKGEQGIVTLDVFFS